MEWNNNIGIVGIAENQRMVNLRDLMGLPPDKNEAKITYSILPRSRSKTTCLQPKHRVDLKSLLAESETQSHAKMTPTREVSKGCSTSMLTVSGPPKKKAKIDYKEVRSKTPLLRCGQCGHTMQFSCDFTNTELVSNFCNVPWKIASCVLTFIICSIVSTE